MSLRRMESLEVSNGVVVPYVHNASAEGLGRIGVLVALESTADAAALVELESKLPCILQPHHL